ncbi:GGDEF domain-containing protein [Telmatospirillum sp.]|uniref:GGDEF domain-containing protein n=1 Tax=Telmatospirillum sp. TaxID=2079197 RepID=UPI0028518B80|nr:GGDEF domain-containing protein [Telmatospirillum sp.]MDR3439500.1 GGDEF domain-containing protein [Telmatospirillum sp.]
MRTAFKIAVVYFLVSVVWVGGSDWALARLFPKIFPTISLYKGWGFVLMTSLLLFLLLRNENRKRDEVERALRQHAIHDSLTGLLNRSCFMETLEKAIAQAERDDASIGVIFFDLDGFKEVNDQLGHDAGDRLLIEVGQRVLGLIRSADSAARFGGDEFVLLVRGDSDGVAALAWRLLEAMRRPFILDGSEIHVSTSVGYALYPDDGQKSTQLLRAADMAMYHVKGNVEAARSVSI